MMPKKKPWTWLVVSKILAMESSRQKGQQPSLPVMDCKPNLLVRLATTIRIFQVLFAKEEFKLSLIQLEQNELLTKMVSKSVVQPLNTECPSSQP